MNPKNIKIINGIVTKEEPIAKDAAIDLSLFSMTFFPQKKVSINEVKLYPDK